ncbi:hypothetical protein BGZ61DRAFT_571798 [Ilyonectria robusta]|uniref:uncharacterized protein n=1 Tax=Ilyonectria robusta TaxID=1079257 RepID=UPI001E8CF44D|nr:uncharacterized protein BGZ61DRAFT_571798 [Ilyonectria robusta]KAH8721710.1 hypothetical protein BGZ61DRAFT_571798 [Ilyonectria robusta]
MASSSIPSTSAFGCSACPASFNRREHLQRHLLSHSSDRSFHCTFCDQSFNRRDVLKRHWTSCRPRIDANVDIPTLFQHVRGKKRKSCDRCVRLKRACNLQKPCQTCLTRNEECSYNRVADRKLKPSSAVTLPLQTAFVEDPMPNVGMEALQTIWDSTDVLQISTQDPLPTGPILDRRITGPLHHEGGTLGTIRPRHAAISMITLTSGWGFPFLSRFTLPNGLATSFECGTRFERQQLIQRHLERSSYSFQNLTGLDIGTWDAETDWVSAVALQPYSLHCQWVSKTDEGLFRLTNEIVQRIKDITISKPRGSKNMIDWSPAMENICYNFFSPANLEKFLLLFWGCWYRNCPIFHKPSFVAEHSSPTLVASMALIGACSSPNANDRIHANVWFNCMEEVVFNDEILQDESIVLDEFMHGRKKIRNRLEAIQAAYLVCIVQNWEGSKESKQRIRRHRYTTLIIIARGFDFSRVSLKDVYVDDVSNFDWNEFIFLETLIRTGTFIFLLDSAFVVLHNSPPRMMLSELNIDLTCPDACFEANSAEECFILLYDSKPNGADHPSLNISTTLELLCRTDCDDLESLKHLSILNMFTIVTALHYLIFHFQATLADLSQATPAEVGLSKWISLWHQGACLPEMELRRFPSCEDMWKRVGFMQFAPEYYLLSRIMLDRWKVCTSSPPLWMEMPAKRPAALKYDESEMDQFRELITSI